MIYFVGFAVFCAVMAGLAIWLGPAPDEKETWPWE